MRALVVVSRSALVTSPSYSLVARRSFSSHVFSRPPLSVVDMMGRKKKGGKEDSKPTTRSTQDADVDIRKSLASSLQEKIAGSLERLKKDFSLIQAGRASPDLLAKLQVDHFGTLEPLARVAQVAVKDAHTLQVSVFDPSLVARVAQAIRESGLPLNPQIVGSAIKVSLPRVTQEFREELAKKAAAAAEEARVAVRKHRHDALALAKKAKDDLSKDEMYALEEELTKLTNASVKKIQEEQDKKVKEVTKAD